MTFALKVDLRCDSCTGEQCDGASCECCAGPLSTACATTHHDGHDDDDDDGGAFIASAERIRISHDRGLAVPPPHDDSPSLVAIFVPPSIIDPVLRRPVDTADDGSDPGAAGGSKDTAVGESENNDEQDRTPLGPRHECCCTSWVGAAKSAKDGCSIPLMNDILCQIHPSLSGLLVKGIISTRSVSRAVDNCESVVDLVLIEVPKSDVAHTATVAALIEETHGGGMASVSHAVIKVLHLSRISFVASNSVVSRGAEESESITAPSEEPDHSQQRLGGNDVGAVQKLSEIPSCPVCLHRIDPQRLGWPRPKNQQLCSQYCPIVPAAIDASTGVEACSNTRYLTPWPSPQQCRACSVIWEQWKLQDPPDSHVGAESNEAASQRLGFSTKRAETRCFKCGMKETLWVCLTCGVVGCGRYSLAHAKEHYSDTGHPYSLELVTQRIWDYTTGEFAQRGDLLDCPSMRHRLGKNQPLRRMGSNSFGAAPPRKDADGFQDYRAFEDMDGENGSISHSFSRGHSFHPDDPSPKKATMIGEEYEVLLQSALEDQAQHYEGELSRLIADLTAERVDNGTMTAKEMSEIDSLRGQISDLRSETDSLSTQLLDAQGQEAGHRATCQRLLREQGAKKDRLDKIKEEAQKEKDEGKAQIEDMEQQVADLKANLKMAKQIAADKELSNAQIFGTTSVPSTKTPKRGKKHRRLLRKK